MEPSDLLVVFAMPEEAQDRFVSSRSRVVFTGIGKINAAYSVTKAIGEGRPRLVVNFGTAGSPVFPARTLVECTKFVQRDIDLSPLGFERGATPFDPTPVVLEAARRFPRLPEGVCGTGDNFEVALNTAPGGSLGAGPSVSSAVGGAIPRSGLIEPGVIEMEAYAIAKVCYKERVPFVCVKYITDGSDEGASEDWSANLPFAAEKFAEIYGELIATS